ncbi:hypothetical protein N5079_17640 [Planotetraspora sp. A-T 1434]|uniref:restriction endonuclease subunit S n=1 Tax=Planotetraspora sp. A-T 1434 TaxID=2979219 RepID=UPI0021C1C667|nr:hypothetical protein [Planotetraspora sp. A-T 1434]MCT9932027.1 hypothetical protein [Planotetraspora sp. A-T 1434]
MTVFGTTLGELIKPAPTKRAGSVEYPILSMTMHNGLVDQESKFRKRVASADISQYKVVSKGQLVVGFPIDEGVLSFQNLYPHAIVSPAYHIWDLADSFEVDTGYLQRFLRSPDALAYYASKLRGTTARRRTLPNDLFLALPVPLPAISEQRRIAQVLDSVDVLRAKRRETINYLDDVTRSIFVAMFGDPAQNPEGWPRAPLGTLLSRIDSGHSPQCMDRPARGGEWGVLKLSSITSCEFNPLENKALPETASPRQENEVRPGDLLFSRKNTKALVAACALVRQTPRRLLMPDLIFRLEPDPTAQIDLTFLHQLLIFPSRRRQIQELATGSSASMSNISKAKLASVEIEIPPLSRQQAFAERVAVVDRIRSSQRSHLSELDALFTSMQHRAFRGEL